jgi:hypothetical protein
MPPSAGVADGLILPETVDFVKLWYKNFGPSYADFT